MIDESSYTEGFIQGFRAIKGAAAALPPVSPQPPTKPGRTPFQMGLGREIERGKGWERGDLIDKD